MISDLGYGAYFFLASILVAMGIWSFFFVPDQGHLTRGDGHALLATYAQSCMGSSTRPTDPQRMRSYREEQGS